jgi:hypothetical protein
MLRAVQRKHNMPVERLHETYRPGTTRPQSLLDCDTVERFRYLEPDERRSLSLSTPDFKLVGSE